MALALANLACGRKDEALRQLERACRDGDLWSVYQGLTPVWDELRALPRFERLLNPGRQSRKHAPVRNGTLPRSAFWAASLAAAASLIVLVAAYTSRRPAVPAAFQNSRISKLTTNGLAERAVLSPNGHHVAYVLRHDRKASIWVRQAGRRLLVPAACAESNRVLPYA